MRHGGGKRLQYQKNVRRHPGISGENTVVFTIGVFALDTIHGAYYNAWYEMRLCHAVFQAD